MNKRAEASTRAVLLWQWLVFFTIAFCILSQSSKSYCEQWTFLGLENEKINSIKQSGSFLYACTDNGIFRKDLYAEDDWVPLGLQGSEIGDILITSASLGTMFAGMTHDDPPVDMITMYKSTDGGASWSPSGSGIEGVSIQTIVHHPVTPDTIYAAGSLYIVRSLDGGTNWTEINYSPFGDFDSIAIGNSAPYTIYAGGTTGGEQATLIKSTDNGETWDSIYDFPFGPDILVESSIYSIAIDPEDSDIFYTYEKGSIYKFIDGGNAHVQIPVEDMYLYPLKIDPKDRTHFYAGGGEDSFSSGLFSNLFLGLHESKDACVTWRRIRSPESALDILDIIYDQNNSDIIYVATESGVYKFFNAPSTLPANTWGKYK